MYSIDEIFDETGLLKKAINGFTVRAPQQKMAEAVQRAIDVDAELIVEAETGTGKTFAYLVPVFLSNKKAIISTGTKTLQDQLFFKDIPIIKKILPNTGKVVLLKGRANYLCLYRLEKSRTEGRFASRQLISQLQTIYEWSASTTTGDVAELTTIPEDSGIWPHATSTVDNCLNQDCEFYKNCHVIKARQEALSADVVVVNHHLFFADTVLQDEGFGELLPNAEIIVFDEAHHLPDIASHFFSTSLTSRQINELARDVENEANLFKELSDLIEDAKNLQISVQQMRNAFGIELKKSAWPESLPSVLKEAIEQIQNNLQKLEEQLKSAAVRSKELENQWRRAIKMIERFAMLTGETPENNIHWYETHTQSFSLQLTPMIVANYFKAMINRQKRAWIFTSATLSVKNQFNLFVETLGLENALQLQLKSPFDYSSQALLFVPRGLPDTRSRDFAEKMLESILPILQATRGRAFLLFTSYKMLDFAAEYLQSKLSFPLLLQGSMPKHELLEQFKKYGNAVLLGTSSFWYGVDVKGDALSCVIIDKLPFTAPDDPILQARITMMRKKGLDPFQAYQLPQAVLTLKQGAGRLIRDNQDHGILVICDPRLVGARYADVFLQSLPNMQRTRDLQKVYEFIEMKLNHEIVSH